MTARNRVPAGTEGAWQRPVRDFPSLIHLAPPVSQLDSSLSDVVKALSRDPGARSVFITDADDRLLGAISESAIDFDLMTIVLPQPMWSELQEWDTRKLLRAARAKALTARELMTRVDALTPGRPLSEAVALMSHSKDRIVPLVDEQGRLLGYLTLFESLVELMKTT